MTATLHIFRLPSRRPTHAEIEAALGIRVDWRSPNVSLSHSGGYVCLMQAAVPCGIDIEARRPLRRNVAEKYFFGYDGDFFELWTKKEAAAKLLSHEGGGISLMAVPKTPLEGLSLVTISRPEFAVTAATRNPVRLSVIVKGAI